MATGLLSIQSHDEIGTLYSNTICVHWESTSLAGDADHDNAVHEAGEWLEAHYRALVRPNVVIDRFRLAEATMRGVPASWEAIRSYADAGTGGGATLRIPREIACLLSFRTDHAGRSGRGHIALPTWRDDNVLNDSTGDFNMGSGYITNVTALADALMAGHTWDSGLHGEQHMSLRVWSRKHGESYDVTAYTVRSKPRWVERRQTAP